MTSLCLDTSAYTHFKAGHADAVAALSAARNVIVPVVVLGELRAGFRLGKHAQKNESELSAFLEMSVVRISDADDETSFHYAEIFMALRRNGTPAPTNDMWIAAIALKEGATVITFDKHFELIRSIGTLLLERDK